MTLRPRSVSSEDVTFCFLVDCTDVALTYLPLTTQLPCWEAKRHRKVIQVPVPESSGSGPSVQWSLCSVVLVPTSNGPGHCVQWSRSLCPVVLVPASGGPGLSVRWSWSQRLVVLVPVVLEKNQEERSELLQLSGNDASAGC